MIRSYNTWPAWRVEAQSSPFEEDNTWVATCEQCDWSGTYTLYSSACSGGRRHHRSKHQVEYETWARAEIARVQREYEEGQS